MLNIKERKKINKLSRNAFWNNFFNRDKCIFDDGQVEEIYSLQKETFRYSIIKLNKNISTNEYLVFLIIHIGKKNITNQLCQNLKGKAKANKYFENLKNYIYSHTNEEIINICYKDKYYYFRIEDSTIY